MFGTADSVLNKEVSSVQSVLYLEVPLYFPSCLPYRVGQTDPSSPMHQQTTHFHHLLPPISLGGFCEGIVIRLNHDNVGRGWVYPELPRSVHESGGDLQRGGEELLQRVNTTVA